MTPRRALLFIATISALGLAGCESSSKDSKATGEAAGKKPESNAESNAKSNARSKPARPSWVHKEAALAEAARAGKPAMLDLTAAWCQPCISFEKETFANKKVIEALAGWVLVRLDVTRQNDSHRELQARYQASNLPAVILFDASGAEVHRFDRFVGPDEFIAELERLAIPAR